MKDNNIFYFPFFQEKQLEAQQATLTPSPNMNASKKGKLAGKKYFYLSFVKCRKKCVFTQSSLFIINPLHAEFPNKTMYFYFQIFLNSVMS